MTTQRRAGGSRRIIGTAGICVGLWCCFTAAPALATPRDDALAAARSYVAAVNSHSPARICPVLTPEFQQLLIRQDSRASTCTGVLAGYFRDYYSDRRWSSARILGISGVSIDQDRAQLRMRVDHHYVCRRGGRCSRRSYHFHTPELINLLLRDGRWLVAKEDAVLRATGIDHPDTEEVFFYPVGDAITVAMPARVHAPRFTCAGPTRSARDPANDLDGDSGPTAAPWLDIRRIEVRSQGSRGCVSLILAAPPRPASSYMADVAWKLSSGVLRNINVGLQIDARGGLHPLFGNAGPLGTPSVARFLPRFGLVGNRLTFQVTPRQGVAFRRPWLVGAVADSLQTDEPLIASPLDAEDVAPGRPLESGCLRYPHGGISHGEVC